MRPIIKAYEDKMDEFKSFYLIHRLRWAIAQIQEGKFEDDPFKEIENLGEIAKGWLGQTWINTLRDDLDHLLGSEKFDAAHQNAGARLLMAVTNLLDHFDRPFDKEPIREIVCR